MNHTIGKLHVFDEYYPKIDICAKNSYVCFMALEKENIREQVLEDARRIVALWNAAVDAGLSTEEIEAKGICLCDQEKRRSDKTNVEDCECEWL